MTTTQIATIDIDKEALLTTLTDGEIDIIQGRLICGQILSDALKKQVEYTWKTFVGGDSSLKSHSDMISDLAMDDDDWS